MVLRKEMNMDEAARIMGNAASMPGYHGTASAKVVDEMNERFDTQTIICRGYLRRMVFEKKTDKHYSFRTVPYE